MATDVLERPLVKRVSWGALFAGFFVGFGIWFLLLSLVAAIGLTSFNPRESAWTSLGQGFGFFGGIAGIIAVFCGAWCASWLSASTTRDESVLHGVTVWGFMLVMGLVLAGMAISGAASMAGGAVSRATSLAAPGAAGATAASAGKAAAWGAFFEAILTLAAAVIGGVLGGPPYRYRLRRREEAAAGRPLTPQHA